MSIDVKQLFESCGNLLKFESHELDFGNHEITDEIELTLTKKKTQIENDNDWKVLGEYIKNMDSDDIKEKLLEIMEETPKYLKLCEKTHRVRGIEVTDTGFHTDPVVTIDDKAIKIIFQYDFYFNWI